MNSRTRILSILAVSVAFYVGVWTGCTGIGFKSARTSEIASGDKSPVAASMEDAETTQTTTSTEASGGSTVTNLTMVIGGGWFMLAAVAGGLYRSRSGWKRSVDRLVKGLEMGKKSKLTAENVCDYVKHHPKDATGRNIHERVVAVTKKGHGAPK